SMYINAWVLSPKRKLEKEISGRGAEAACRVSARGGGGSSAGACPAGCSGASLERGSSAVEVNRRRSSTRKPRPLSFSSSAISQSLRGIKNWLKDSHLFL